jgi:SAM-dependent methyltransferase
MSDQPANQVSEQDLEHLKLIRANVNRFLSESAARYALEPARMLDVAPQNHEGARPFFPAYIEIETFDIDPKSAATHIGDLCQKNAAIRDATYDFIVCTEVLEHTLQPFAAVAELHRMLKPGGKLFVSVPFNFRIHGPLPDCWRFTEHGLRALFADWELIQLEALETALRFLMPVHYTLIARKPVR